MNQKEYLWVEKYRPKTIEECVLPDSIKETFKEMVESGERTYYICYIMDRFLMYNIEDLIECIHIKLFKFSSAF